MSLVLKWQGYRDLRVLCKLYPKDSWYSEYASSSQYAKILYVSGILYATVSQGTLTGILICLGF